MKKSFVFLLCGVFLYPAGLLANDGADALLDKTSIYKEYPGSSSGVGLLNTLHALNAQAAKPKKNFFKNMRYSGYARLFVLSRQMQDYYNIAPTNGLSLPYNLTVGDGYQQPLLLFRMEGNPTAKTYFNMELQFDHRLLTQFTSGPFISDSYGRGSSLYVVFKLEGAWEINNIGKFKLTAGGGANWYRLSQSTLWGYQYRDDLFDRYPWEPEGHDFARYNSAYAVGDIPRDQRFGMAATQGFILEGTNLPAGFDAAILYGKTQYTGGFQSYLTQIPQNFVAGRIGKKIGDHKIGANYFNQFGYDANQVQYKMVDTLNNIYVKSNALNTVIGSLDGKFEFKKFNVFAEIGGGSYLSSTNNAGISADAKPGLDHASNYKSNWSEMIFAEIDTKKELTYLPIKLAAYRIGRYIVNNTSSIANTSVEDAKANPAVPDQYYTNYFDGMVTDIGQLANNRQGLNLTTNKDFGKLKARLGLGIAQEIVNLVGDLKNGARGRYMNGANADSSTLVPYTNSITFEQRLNSVTRSRFGFYERFQGPYDRTMGIFRHAYDNIAITDTAVNYKKSFSTAQLDLKYKLRIFGKELILTNFAIYSSVQDNWSPIPVFTDKAFLRYFYEEFMGFYAIHPKLTLSVFWGMSRAVGNSRTELADANGNLITDAKGRPIADPNGKAIDQTGYGYGVGIDYNFSSSASLNLRQRWFTHSDKNFIRDKFNGNEMTIEFKVFF